MFKCLCPLYLQRKILIFKNNGSQKNCNKTSFFYFSLAFHHAHPHLSSYFNNPLHLPVFPIPRLHFHLLRVKEKISWSEYTICKNCCLGDTIVYQSNSEFSSHMQKNTQYLRPHSGKAEERKKNRKWREKL